MKGIEVAESLPEPAQNKLWITCVTCGITKAFYTPHGVRYFELTHLNHEVRKGKVSTEEIKEVEEEPMTEATVAALEDEQPAELPTVVLAELVVSLATTGPEKTQSIRVRGLGPEEKDLFVLNFPVVDASEAKSLIKSGEYIQDELPPMGRFTWTPQLIKASDQVAAMVGLQKPVVEVQPAKVEVQPAKVEPPHPPAEVVSVEPEKADTVPEPEAKAEPEVKAEPMPRPVPKPEPVRIIPRREAKKETPLLLAKSSYIQENEENRIEAMRISKVLMEFRWNIEPPYGINVLFDDNMSVQSNTGVISTGVIRKIEELGYAFVAFEASKGVPTAWFKKNGKKSSSQRTLFPDVGEVILPNLPDGGNGFAKLSGESAI